jgi:hypothetical protein
VISALPIVSFQQSLNYVCLSFNFEELALNDVCLRAHPGIERPQSRTVSVLGMNMKGDTMPKSKQLAYLSIAISLATLALIVVNFWVQG